MLKKYLLLLQNSAQQLDRYSFHRTCFYLYIESIELDFMHQCIYRDEVKPVYSRSPDSNFPGWYFSRTRRFPEKNFSRMVTFPESDHA